MKDQKNYPIQSDTLYLDYLCSLEEDDAKQLIGAKIIRVKGGEYEMKLYLDTGKVLITTGHTYEDSGLDVELIKIEDDDFS